MNRPLPPSRPGPLDAGLFDPASPERSWTLPADWYFNPDIYKREHAAIYHRSWWYQGHVGDLPQPRRLSDRQRRRPGNLHHPWPRRRAARLLQRLLAPRAPLLEGQGNTRLIVCPYHQWCYQADGCFRGARGRDTLKDWIPI